MQIIDQPAELNALYGSLYGARAWHAVAGLVKDVILQEAQDPTLSGRTFLVGALGNRVDLVLSEATAGRPPSVDDIIPMLRDPLVPLTRQKVA
jgi:hypothetical protein